MGVKYEVVAVTGEYTNKDGETKKRYAKVGVILETKNGPMLKLETVPLGWDGFAYLNEPKSNEERSSTRRGQSAGMDDDPPF